MRIKEVKPEEHRLPLGYRNILKTHVFSHAPPPQKKLIKLTRITKEVKREGNIKYVIAWRKIHTQSAAVVLR